MNDQITRLSDLMGAQSSHGANLVDIDKIEPDPEQPRRHWDEEKLAGLAASISAQGVVQPLIVRPCTTRPRHFILIAGERRWRAARLAGLPQVPALIRHVEGDVRLAMQMAENLDREDLDVLDEALGVERLANVFGLTGRAIAKLLGKAESWVSQRRQIARQAETLRPVVRDLCIQDVETLTVLGALHTADAERYSALLTSGSVSRQGARKALREAKEDSADGQRDSATSERSPRLARRPLSRQGATPASSHADPPAAGVTAVWDGVATDIGQVLGLNVEIAPDPTLPDASKVTILCRNRDDLDRLRALILRSNSRQSPASDGAG